MNQLFDYVIYSILSSILLYTIYDSFRLHAANKKNKKLRLLSFAHKKINNFGQLITSDAKIIMSPLSQKVCLLNIKKHLLAIHEIQPSKHNSQELINIEKRINKLPSPLEHNYDQIVVPNNEHTANKMVTKISSVIFILKLAYFNGMLKENTYHNEVTSLRHLALRFRIESILNNAQIAIKRERLGIASMHYNNALTLLESVTEKNDYLVNIQEKIKNDLQYSQQALDSLLTDGKHYQLLTAKENSAENKYNQTGITNMDDSDMIFNNKKVYYGE